MNLLQSILLGIIQGLTEFIPVSSTAHLLIAQKIMGLNPGGEILAFTTLIQMGTVLSLIVYYWKDLWSILLAVLRAIGHGRPFEDPQARLGWYILIATIPAGIAGVFLKNLVEVLFSALLIAASIRLLLTAVLLAAAEGFGRKDRSMEDVNWIDAGWVGLFQVLSIFPGASRSGSTIAGGMTRGLNRAAAARFAFLISAPIMLAAGAYESFDLFKHQQVASTLLAPILVGIVTAAIVGYLAIRWLLAYLSRHSLWVFTIYCTGLGLVSLIFAILTR